MKKQLKYSPIEWDLVGSWARAAAEMLKVTKCIQKELISIILKFIQTDTETKNYLVILIQVTIYNE